MLYHIVMVFAIHHYESVTGIHVSPYILNPYPSLSPHLIPPGYHRTLALGALLHTSNSHWSSILHMVVCMFPCCSLKSSHLLLLHWVWKSVLFFFFFHYLNFIFKLYNIVLVLPNIEMNPPQVYMCSPSWTLLPPPSPYHPSGSSQCTSPKHPVSCIEPGLATRFIHDIIHVTMPFSQIIPPSPSPKSPKDCSIHQCLFCCLVYRVIATIFLNSLYMR